MWFYDTQKIDTTDMAFHIFEWISSFLIRPFFGKCREWTRRCGRLYVYTSFFISNACRLNPKIRMTDDGNDNDHTMWFVYLQKRRTGIRTSFHVNPKSARLRCVNIDTLYFHFRRHRLVMDTWCGGLFTCDLHRIPVPSSRQGRRRRRRSRWRH